MSPHKITHTNRNEAGKSRSLALFTPRLNRKAVFILYPLVIRLD